MSKYFSRRDFLKLGGLSLGSLAFSRFTPNIFAPDFINFDDGDLVRVGTSRGVAVYNKPTDQNEAPVGFWNRDDLVHVYEEVVSDDPKFATNPIWYRVWGGYMWRANLQPVKTLLNVPLTLIPDGTRVLAEVTVPFTEPWKRDKSSPSGWNQLGWRLYYESTHWIEAIEDGPDGQPWYRIWDHIASFPYYVPAMHLRLIPSEDINLINPNVPWDQKRIDVNLTTQTLTAYEYDADVFQTTIASGIPSGNHTTTPQGDFNIMEKLPSEHMGLANIYAQVDDYILAGVPWTSYFTKFGHAFHGTYWHDNFGTPMSHGCVNMRTADAKWLFLWANWFHPQSVQDGISWDNQGLGTAVNIHY
ncbi:MAG: L,D-transpeptidase [Anaerolineales bacterium]